ncbi:universal stress protein [Haloarcula sp. 1CSR25-25]|jgi:nucleotide-binding universal stress UspA family protein|uniref:universal stress protein n=1 Tax=Haloarcula sp. 1CSR25-25 TaxID=2862545 RepID=UPI002895591A|nr:universal stress protein [Haloarcula sp. 1CSR25-25]MDT3437208.1 universal stress protein [Haloarcula sp. 1CSR25-25]
MGRRILIPVDSSPQAREAVRHASTVHPADDLVLLHVVEYSESITDPDRGGRKHAEGWYAKARDDAEDLFERLTEGVEHEGEITTAITDGSPASAIVDYLAEHDIDQVVIGSHGRTGATRILIGSVSESVARRSPVPVTVVH